jgi:hypothetical protein
MKIFSVRTTCLLSLPFPNETYWFEVVSSDEIGDVTIYIDNREVTEGIFL